MQNLIYNNYLNYDSTPETQPSHPELDSGSNEKMLNQVHHDPVKGELICRT